jgi:hypothetical protein
MAHNRRVAHDLPIDTRNGAAGEDRNRPGADGFGFRVSLSITRADRWCCYNCGGNVIK